MMIIDKIGNTVIIDPHQLGTQQSYRQSIAYFGGTFDPFHIAHFLIARELCSFCDEVWIHPHDFTRSKKPIALINRQIIVSLGIKDLDQAYLMKYHESVSATEYYLPHFLEGEIEGLSFSDVIGDDHLDRLLTTGIDRPLYCFTRSSNRCEIVQHSMIRCLDVDTSGISSSEIREELKAGNVADLPLQEEVLNYILAEALYT